MDEITDFKSLVSRWPSDAALARRMGVKANTVFGWRERNNIPEVRWSKLLSVARDCGFTDISLPLLMKISRARTGDGVAVTETASN